MTGAASDAAIARRTGALRAWLRALVLGGTALRLADAPRTGPARQRRLRDFAAQLNRAVGRYRRLLAATCAGFGCLLAVSTLAPPAPASAPVLAAVRDLPAGAVLHPSDLRLIRLPPAAVPAGALADPASAVGHTTSGPLRRGEPLTDVRLAGGPLSRPAPGMVATPVRLADAQAAALLRPGERVDVLAASTAAEVSGGARVVAQRVTVVAVPPSAAPGGADLATAGALVVLATTPIAARLLAQAQVSERLSAVVVG